MEDNSRYPPNAIHPHPNPLPSRERESPSWPRGIPGITSRIIFLVGPTAAGKTEVGVLLAQRLKGEVVSCDAMQVYREVNIATSKPAAGMRQAVPHHLLDVVSVTEEFDVAHFNRLAVEAIKAIHAKGRTPVVLGGSGMYMQVLLDGIFTGPGKDQGLRRQLQQQLEESGADVLYARLKEADPKAAAKIHPNDHRRLLRALEVFLQTSRPISGQQPERQGLWAAYPVALFCLNRSRPELYERIGDRVEQMFAQGIVDEIKALRALPLSLTAQRLIGLKEIAGYLRGDYDLERAKYLTKLNTRHYAKRQLTWFRKEKRLNWIESGPGEAPEAVAERICVWLK